MTPTSAPAPFRLHAVALGPDPSPGEVVRRLAHRDRVTAFAGEWSWGALVACDPARVAPAGADPFALLGAVPRLPTDPRRPHSVGGGWFGFLDHAPPGVRPGAALAWYRDVLRHDGRRWWFEALVACDVPPDGRPDRRRIELPVHPDLASAQRRLAELTADLAVAGPTRDAFVEVTRWPDRDEHLAAVERCVTEIRRGEIFQANIATEVGVRLHGDVHEAWARTVESRPPARAALVAGADRTALSASPELFLHRAGDEAVTAPIKGTRPRTGDPDLDQHERSVLAASVKDAAENVMIVDLMRNDLARVARPGGVRVGRLLTVEPHPGVWHLVSRVHATLGTSTDDEDLLAASFPPGSVTGAPKVRACSVIADCERGERGLFTGAIGGVSPSSGLEFNVAIRTLDLGPSVGGTRDGRLGVGGGITVDSDPAEEFDECLTKAAPVLASLGGPAPPPPPGVTRPADRSVGLFETLGCTDGVPHRLGDHAARLRRSYLAVTHRALTAPVEAEVRRVASGLTGHHRIRVDATPGDPSAVEVRAVGWEGPVPVTRQPGLVVRVHRGTDGESHKFTDRRWLDAHETACGPTSVLADPTGSLLESTRSSIGAVHRGLLWVPALDGRILPGTGRRALLDLLEPDAVRIAALPVAALADADGFFLVNSLRGIQWVREVHDDDGPVAVWATPDRLIRALADGLGH